MINKSNLSVIFVCILLSACSFGVGGGWNDLSEEIEIAKARKNAKIIFSTQKRFTEEIENRKQIITEDPKSNKNWLYNYYSSSNYIPHLLYNNNKTLYLKTKKIGKNTFKVNNIDFRPILKNNIIYFFDPSGTIFSYSIKNKKIVWEYNFYKKRYKKKPKELNLLLSSENLIVSDNLGYVYSLQQKTGKINWAKNYTVPFRSNIKIDGDDIFLINQDNKLYIISENNGKQKLDLETFPSFLKTNSKTNISLDSLKKNVYFVTSAAEIYSLNYKNKNINWLFNLTGSNSDQQVDLFYSSPIIYQNDQVIISNSFSTFSMNADSGTLNWEIPISSKLSPIILNNYVIFCSEDGFFININRQSGKIVWSRNILQKLKKLSYEKTGGITSILFLSNSIFATTEKGYFIFVDHQNGKVKNYFKVAKSFFSKPIVSSGKIVIVDSKMRILQFD